LAEDQAQGVPSYVELYGYIEIEYQWPWAVVCATIRNVDSPNSLFLLQHKFIGEFHNNYARDFGRRISGSSE